MGEHYDRVVASLPHLTPPERAKVLDRLKGFQSLTPAEDLASATGSFRDTAGRPAIDDVLDVIAAVVLRANGERVAPAALRRSPQFRAFADKATALSAFAEKHVRNRTARRALLDLGFELLYQDLNAAGFSVTSRMLMQCAHQVPSVIDKAFPGYARAGLLGMLFAKREHGNGKATARAGSSLPRTAKDDQVA